MQIRDRIKEFRRISAEKIRPNPKNWRTHPKEQSDALRGILSEIGLADAVLVREIEPDVFMLIDGHLRCETIGNHVELPALILDVTESEADKILATLDPLAGMAEKDAEILAGLLSDLSAQGDQLASMVFPDYIIDPLMSADWKPPEEGEMPTKEEKPKAKSIECTDDQYEMIRHAVEEFRRFHEDESISLPDAVSLICQKYIDERQPAENIIR